jgi:uncharacterized protein YlxW (UPF0749 family)
MIAQRKKKMRGKSETVLKTLEILDEEIPKVEKTLFTSLVDDNKKMEERMTALEKKVTDVEKKVDTVISDNQLIKSQLANNQDMLEQLNKAIQANINIHKNRLKLVASVLQNKWFWMLAILALLIIGGVDIAQLAGIIRMESISTN